MMTSVERVLFTINQTPQEHQQRSNHSSLAVAGMDDFINQTEPINRDASYRDSNLLRRSGWPWQGGLCLHDVETILLSFKVGFSLIAGISIRCRFQQFESTLSGRLRPGVAGSRPCNRAWGESRHSRQDWEREKVLE